VRTLRLSRACFCVVLWGILSLSPAIGQDLTLGPYIFRGYSGDNVPQFNPEQGTLQAVDVQLYAAVSGNDYVWADKSCPCGITYSFSVSLWPTPISAVSSTTIELPYAPDGDEIPIFLYLEASASGILTGKDRQPFLGEGSVPLSFNWSLNMGGNPVIEAVRATILYHYTAAVPEPGLAGWLTGASVLGLVLRKKRRKR
jgi:hypothetical protein